MSAFRKSVEKIVPREAAAQLARDLRTQGLRIAFTNGCFDIIHAGHVAYLEEARSHADVLIVGLNSDRSIAAIKGAQRPIVPQDQRARVVAGLAAVDYVVVFDEDEPAALIAEIQPDVLVKGADWSHYVSGGDIVEARGGEVVLVPLVPNLSTTGIIEKIAAMQSPEEK